MNPTLEAVARRWILLSFAVALTLGALVAVFALYHGDTRFKAIKSDLDDVKLILKQIQSEVGPVRQNTRADITLR